MTTADHLPGEQIVRTLGVVSANSVRARNVGRDLTAAFRNITGGEVGAYRDLLTESREQALDRLEEKAREMGADAIIALRVTSGEVMQGVSEILAYGTAVKLD